MTAPNVLEHADFRRYLDAWFSARKAKNARYSHRAFARKVGSQDPSVLLNIVRGRRRLPEDKLDAFVVALGLADEEADYFRWLVRFGQAQGRQDRERAFAGLRATRHQLSAPEVDSSRFLYLSHPMYAAIHELAQCKGFVSDPAWVAAKLRPQVSVAEASEALGLLERLGFLVRHGEVLQPAEPTVRTDERVAALGSYGYHRTGLEAAIDALDVLHGEASEAVAAETAFLGITVAVPVARLADVRRMLWEAQLQVLHACEAWTDERDQVVQISLQMVPVSSPTR